MNFDDRLTDVKEDLKDIAFNFFKFQGFTDAIIKPYNNMFNGPLQNIFEAPYSYQTSSTIGLIEFSNITFVPPFKGSIILSDITSSLKKLRKERNLKIDDLQRQYPKMEDRESDSYLRKLDTINNKFISEEKNILHKKYSSYGKENWLLPADCRDGDLSYMVEIYADVTLREANKRDKTSADVFANSEDEAAAEMAAYVNPAMRQYYMNKFTQKSTERSKTY